MIVNWWWRADDNPAWRLRCDDTRSALRPVDDSADRGTRCRDGGDDIKVLQHLQKTAVSYVSDWWGHAAGENATLVKADVNLIG